MVWKFISIFFLLFVVMAVIRNVLKLTVMQCAAALGLTTMGAAPGSATSGLGPTMLVRPAPATATTTHSRHCPDFKGGSHAATATGRMRRRRRRRRRRSATVCGGVSSRHSCSAFYLMSYTALIVGRAVGYTGGATAVRFATVGLLALSAQGGHGFLVGTPVLRGIRLAFCDPRS
jgi:hypothetical protein